MEVMLKYRGEEGNMRKFVSIIEAIAGSEPFEDIEEVDSYECSEEKE